MDDFPCIRHLRKGIRSSGISAENHAPNQHNFKDFDLAYAYEVMARAHSASENNDECNSWFNKAKETGELIDSVENKKMYEGDLKAGFWFGCSL